jgi:tetratricopeptide (TPR) repeat protein
MAIEPHSSQTGPAADAALPSMAFQQCLSRLRSGDLAGAESLCRRMLSSNPGEAQVLHLLGAILGRLGRFEEAVEFFSKALPGAADPAPLLHDQGMALARLRRHEQALASYDRAVAARPRYPEAWNSRGELLASLGRHQEALASFDRALADRPDHAGALANRGDAFRALGRPKEALSNYARCLALQPNHARAINHRGMVLAGLGQYREALELHNRAIELAPEDPEAHNARGVALSRLGLGPTALASFARALSLRPDYVEAFLNNADALTTMGRHEEALDSYDRGLAIEPTHLEAVHGRSMALAALDRLEAALEGYDRLIAAVPDRAKALIGKGFVLARLKRYEAALACYDLALELSPDLDEARTGRAGVVDAVKRLGVAEAQFLRGLALGAIGRWTAALEAFDKAIEVRPDYAEAWNARGLALAELDEPSDALESYDRALALRPDYAEAHANRSPALRNLGRIEEAVAAADRALSLDPGQISALNKRGNALLSLGRIAEALDCYDRALAANRDLPESHFNCAAGCLLAGDFERGWKEYEWRWQIEGFEKGKPRLQIPRWLGEEDIAGRTILLHAEQGHGDTIQFCRYVPLVAAKGATVVLAVPPLLKLLLSSLAGASHIADGSNGAPAADIQCALLSLPLALGTRLETIPSAVPYLQPPASHLRRWQEKLGPKRGFRIGIAWSGNSLHKSDRRRSLALEQLEPIVALGRPLYCLQRELRADDLPAFARFSTVEYFGEALRDFADTAALIAQLDLVIAVDTAVAHLAGAMGKQVWVLLPHAPDWRWMLGRDDSPWYPTMRLFRQPRPDDWSPVIDRVRGALMAVAGDR